MGLPSLSVLGNKNNLRQEAILTSLSIVPHVARKGKHGSTETVATAVAMTATGHHAKCSPRDVPSMVKTPKYPLNLAVVDRCIAVIATVKSNRVDSSISNLESIHKLGYQAYVCSR